MYERSDASLLAGRFHEMLDERQRTIAALATETSASILSRTAGPQSETFRMQHGIQDDSRGFGYYMQKKMQMHKRLSAPETKGSCKP